MRAIWALAAAALLAASPVRADISTSERTRVRNAAEVVREFRAIPEKGIPDELWSRAECVVVIPSVKKAALVVGGEYGKGVMSCRAKDSWSAPVFMEMAKASWGLQVGAQENDLVLLVMNRRGVDKMLEDHIALGADASVAAGPIGRTGQAATDLQMKAEILSYSRSHGLFAGIDLSGGVLRPDKDANQDVYGSSVAAENLVRGGVPIPSDVKEFVTSLGGDVRATSGRR
jgi:lipid-binding SYLF domain-containing protein